MFPSNLESTSCKTEGRYLNRVIVKHAPISQDQNVAYVSMFIWALLLKLLVQKAFFFTTRPSILDALSKRRNNSLNRKNIEM